jgi:hypothetical protein
MARIRTIARWRRLLIKGMASVEMNELQHVGLQGR